MSKYTYAGDFKNPTEGFGVERVEHQGEEYVFVTVEYQCECGHACCSRPVLGTRPHDSAGFFTDEDEAYEWIEALRDRFEEDYDDYLEENHHAIAQMERYEMWRNEY